MSPCSRLQVLRRTLLEEKGDSYSGLLGGIRFSDRYTEKLADHQMLSVADLIGDLDPIQGSLR